MQVPQLEQNEIDQLLKGPPQRRANWWLRLTSFGWDRPQESIEERERVRRSRLLSWILLGLLVALVAFIPGTMSDRASAFAGIGALLGIILIIFLNRIGRVTVAGTLLTLLASASTISVIIWSPDGHIHLVYLPALDFMVVPVILGASVLPRVFTFILALFNIGIIYGDMLLQPKSADLLAAIRAYGANGGGMMVLTGRPVALIIICATIAYIWVRSMDVALKRADHAEELRTIEQYFSQQEKERSLRVEEFVQETINAISALANGQEGLLLLSPTHPWQEQATFINTQLKQFHRLKQTSRGNNDQIAQAMESLLKTVQRVNSGQAVAAVLDPRQFRTPVPQVNELARYLYYMLQGRAAPVVLPSRPL